MLLLRPAIRCVWQIPDMKKKHFSKKRVFIAVICLVLTLISIASFTAMAVISNILPSQKQARRWAGDSEEKFSQLSCYLPADEKIKLSDVYAIRNSAMTKLHEASVDADNENTLFVDAWSTNGKANVSSSLGKGSVSVIAVGGSYFDFHPIRLISGSYISEKDLMKDRVLLDEDTAWLLFGGVDLQGLEMRIEGKPFIVSGVIEREQDFASKKAYTAGMGIYMSYDAYALLNENNVGISCYELCMAEPVKGFAQSFIKASFPVKSADIVDNSGRYGFGRLLGLLRQFGTRSMQTMGLVYPYWENAARCTEDWCLLLMFVGMFSAIMPVTVIIILAVRYIKRGKDKLTEELIPAAKDNVEEAIRVRQRKRWERKRGLHEK